MNAKLEDAKRQVNEIFQAPMRVIGAHQAQSKARAEAAGQAALEHARTQPLPPAKAK